MSDRAAIRKVALGMSAGGVVAVTVWFTWTTAARRPIPDINPDGVHPDVVDGIEATRQTVQRNPHSGTAWGRLGMMLKAHEYHAEAIECFEEAARLDAKEFRWPYYLATSLEYVDRPAALAAYRRAVQRRPDLALLRIRLAELLLDMGRFQDALLELKTALKSEPGNGRAEYRMAQLLFRRGRFRESLSRAKQAAQHAPRQREVHELLAQIHGRLAETTAAAKQLAEARELPQSQEGWPDPYLLQIAHLRLDPRWTAYRAKQLIEAGQTEAGIALLEPLVDGQPDQWTFRSQLARAYLSRDQLDRAAEILDAGFQHNPDSFELHRLRGAVHLMRGQWQAGARHLRRAIQIKTDNAAVHFDLGHCLLQLGDREGALAEYCQAVRFHPDNVEARIEIARLLLKQGRSKQAEEQLETVLDISPGHRIARRLLDSAKHP